MCCVLLGTAGLAQASPVTFSVDRMVEIGQVTGTITTDGQLGPLAVVNILDWNLLLDNGAGLSVLLTGPLSGANSLLALSGGLYETASSLMFDTTVEGAYLDFQKMIGPRGFR